MQPAHATDAAPLFETINVSKIFGVFKALNNVSFHVNDGEFVSIVGPSGCGKSTLLNAVAGFLKPTTGTVAHAPARARVEHQRPEHHAVDRHRPVHQVVEIGVEHDAVVDGGQQPEIEQADEQDGRDGGMLQHVHRAAHGTGLQQDGEELRHAGGVLAGREARA